MEKTICATHSKADLDFWKLILKVEKTMKSLKTTFTSYRADDKNRKLLSNGWNLWDPNFVVVVCTHLAWARNHIAA